MNECFRLFQVVAACVSKERILRAYLEKLAAERQQELLEELNRESRPKTERARDDQDCPQAPGDMVGEPR
jgi:hypothetical protein